MATRPWVILKCVCEPCRRSSLPPPKDAQPTIIVFLKQNTTIFQIRQIAHHCRAWHTESLGDLRRPQCLRFQQFNLLLKTIDLAVLAAKHRIISRLAIIPMGLVWRLGVATTATARQVLKFIMKAQPEHCESQHRSPTCAQVAGTSAFLGYSAWGGAGVAAGLRAWQRIR